MTDGDSVLIIGGAGFIGSHIADLLRSLGLKTVILDRSARMLRAAPPRSRRIRADASDPAVIDAALEGVACVIHVAGSTVPGTSDLNPARDIGDNLVSLFGLLEAMKRRRVRRLIYFSSGGAIYSDAVGAPCHEGSELRPKSSYGVVKIAAENYLRIAADRGDLDLAILRPSNPFGPRQDRIGVQGLIGTLIDRGLRGEGVEVWGDGSARRDYLYVEDLARLCARVVQRGATGVYNVGGGRSYSVVDVIEAAAAVLGAEIPIRFRPARPGDARSNLLDCTKARRHLDWAPRVNLVEGIERTARWRADHFGAAIPSGSGTQGAHAYGFPLRGGGDAELGFTQDDFIALRREDRAEFAPERNKGGVL